MRTPPDLRRALENVLMQCHVLDSDERLRTLFMSYSLIPWRDSLPSASSKFERIQLLIDFLYEKRTADGEYVLLLFLFALYDMGEIPLGIIQALDRQQASSQLPSQPYSLEKLRLDAALPEEVCFQRAFDIAVAVRQFNSPILEEDGLAKVKSGIAQLLWSKATEYVQLRIKVEAPECQIIGNDCHDFILFIGQDSQIFHFHLLPKQIEEFSITVVLYQDTLYLGSTRVLLKSIGCTEHLQRIAAKLQFNIASKEIHPINLYINNSQIGVIGDNTRVEGNINLR